MRVLAGRLVFISAALLLLLLYVSSFFSPSPSTLLSTPEYTDVGGVWLLEGDPLPFRRRRSSLSQRRLPGLARDCGVSCRLRLRSHSQLLRLHLHRIHVYDGSHKSNSTHFVPIIQFLDSSNSSTARGGRVPLECLYEARIHDLRYHSVVNLCDDERGIFGLLALPEGVFTVEQMGRSSTERRRHREHIVQPTSQHIFHPPSLQFDQLGEGDREVKEEETSYNYSGQPWEDLKARRTRSRRAANSWDYHVEVLVVADLEMWRYHGRNLETYLLTLFSTVASIYRHESLRAAVNVVVVKIIVLQHEHSGLRITSNAQDTLKQFCRWQQMYNSNEELSRHDVAILLTRGDICRSPGKCDTLGLAELGTMCDREKSCAIIEDNGLSAAFTIAHELGHIFNIPHDDERKCAQFMSLTKANFHIMAPTLEYNTHPWSWSPCSASLLERFLDNNRGQIQCLFDKPYARHYYDDLFEGDPPGRKYDVDQQCKFVFGGDAAICPYMPACRRLWCSVSYGNQQGCRTQHMPWADGTPCQSTKNGGQQFCHRGECVGMTSEYRTKKDGGWGEWHEWGRCSRSCGGGIQKSSRDCNRPAPSNGGKYCTGQRERYRSCATSECPWDTPPFRDVQCADFNGKPTSIYGLTGPVQWVPKYGVAENERCKLYCKVDNSAAFHLLKEKVMDGTPCDQHGYDLCVDGTCMPAGCDRVLNSLAVRDECGVCNGDGSSCETVRGTFNERGSFGYNEVMKIPAGSANIDIRQNGYRGQKEDDNYLALRSADGTFLLNGHYQVSVYRVQIPMQDSIIEYSGSDLVVERINASGPLRSDVYLHVLSVGNLHPPDIRYEYMFPKGSPAIRERPQAMWRKEDRWTECSAPCQGRQTQVVMCVDNDQRRVSERLCPARKPPTNSRMCNIECTLRWMTEELTACSALCGSGIMQLRVFCARLDSSGRASPLSSGGIGPAPCPGPAPPSTRSCYSDCSGRRWTYSEWSGCSESCGDKGIMRRTVRCMDEHGREVDEKQCAKEARLETEKECSRVPCPRWTYAAWSECSRSCDGGVRMRHAQCIDAADRELPSSMCSAATRLDKERCALHECTWWKFSDWTECSVSCGRGVHSRHATCTSRVGTTLENERCDIRERIVQKPCERPACPAWKIGDWSACTVSCGEGWQTRHLRCSDATGESLEVEKCGARPSSHQPCHLGPCPFWKVGEWQACSVSCGDSGVRSRVIECIHREQTVDHSFCGETAVISEQQCNLLPCSSWSTAEWSSCSVSCGVGSQERRVFCSQGKEKKIVEDKECLRESRPRAIKKCERECLAAIALRIPAEQDTAYWATAPWGECSASCGEGVQRRLVVCREKADDVSPQRCAQLERVEREQRCQLRPCSRWMTEEWLPCPSTCGVSVEQRRAVSCVSLFSSQEHLNESLCAEEIRPEWSRSCQLPPCPEQALSPPPGQWKSRPWSKCSVSCGGGWRRRHVICERATCIGSKPKMFEVCNKEACPREENAWQIAPWTTCSVSCGGGEQRRRIWCEHASSRKKVEDSECSTAKPMEQRDCLLPSCPPPSISSASSPIFSLNISARLDWTASPWSACSAKCGRGTRRRVVSCVDATSSTAVASTLCPPDSKPMQSMPCRARCARWKTQPWGECSLTCGVGVHRRLVVCQKGKGRAAKDSDCTHLPKPVHTAPCTTVACPAYKWQTTPWSTCTDWCGGGEQSRRVYCMSSLHRRAAPRMCTHDKQPLLRRKCSTERCPYDWVPSPWNTCSKSCGNGTQIRSVDCRVKSSTATPLSASVPKEKCSALPAPPRTQPCLLLPPCNAAFHWHTTPWQQCSATCGPGIRRRRVRCLDSSGNRSLSRSSCESLSPRPTRSQSCFLKNCLPSTCQEMRASPNGSSLDGNYTLLVDGFPIHVYCAKMNDTIPRAYLNVNPKTNFAEVYGKRLIFPHTCPHEGRRNDSCLCSSDGDSNAGKTYFSKIRVDLLNRKIKTNDFSFTDTHGGVSVPFATAGDCYSMKDCPQGRFSVDLRGTGLRIVDDLQWEDTGHRTASRIERTHRNELIEGECGGYCGKCSPDKYKGLVFEVSRPD